MDRFWNTTDSAPLPLYQISSTLYLLDANNKLHFNKYQDRSTTIHVQSCHVSPLLSRVRIYRPLTEPVNRKSLFIAATSRRHCHYPHNYVSKVT